VTFQNSGRPWSGVGVVLWEPCARTARHAGNWRLDPKRSCGRSDGCPRNPSGADILKGRQHTILYAELPDLGIPIGFASPVAGMPGAMVMPRRGITSRRMFDLQAAAWRAFALSGTGAKIGEAQLNVGAAPLQNREEGQTSWTLKCHRVRSSLISARPDAPFDWGTPRLG
jgi:hypothetical protein